MLEVLVSKGDVVGAVLVRSSNDTFMVRAIFSTINEHGLIKHSLGRLLAKLGRPAFAS